MEWCRIGAKVPSFEASQDAIPCRWMGSFPSCIACSWVGSFLGCNACSCAEASQDVTPAAGPTARNHPEATHPSFRHGSPWSWRQLPRGIACKRCIFTWTSLSWCSGFAPKYPEAPRTFRKVSRTPPEVSRTLPEASSVSWCVQDLL